LAERTTDAQGRIELTLCIDRIKVENHNYGQYCKRATSAEDAIWLTFTFNADLRQIAERHSYTLDVSAIGSGRVSMHVSEPPLRTTSLLET
jgi:hypothetical protein